MSNPTENDTEHRMATIAACEVIAQFMRDGLPLLHWTVDSDRPNTGTFPILSGRAENADEVRAYGRAVGTEPFDPFPRSAARYIEVLGEVRGTHVVVYANLGGTKHAGAAK